MKNVSKKLLSVLIALLMLASCVTLAFPALAEGHGEFDVVIIGGSASFASKNEIFDGRADAGDVLTVIADEAPGRTFEYWKTSDGDIITDSEFSMLVHANGYIAAHYTDTDDFDFGDWETCFESDDCEIPSVMTRENSQGDAEFKAVYTNNGQHSFGEWQSDGNSQQGHSRVCRVCGKEVYEDHDWYDLEVICEPTHDEPGIVRRICSACSYEYDFEIEPTEEHKWGEYTVITPPSASSYGERMRSCVWCGATERSLFLAPDLEELWKDHYMSYRFSTRYGGSREERYFSFTEQDGTVVYLFAMQLTTTNARDNDQTFIYMYRDDGDPSTAEPVYLTKSGTSSSSMMGQFRWAPYDYACDFAGFVEVIAHPDGVNVPGITQGNSMGGRGATLTWRFDDWAEEINNKNYDGQNVPDPLYADMGYEIEADNVSFAKTNVYDPNGSGTLLYSGGGFDGCTTYKKLTAPGQYDYLTVDPATGITVRRWETVSDTNSYFKEYLPVVDAAAYAALSDSEKYGAICVDDVAAMISQFASDRIGIANLTLDVPSPYTAVRVQIDRTVYKTDFSVTGKNWDYNCYSTNVAGVHRTDISQSYPNEFALTFEWNGSNDNFDIFDRWEKWNFASGAWETLSTDTTMVLNTYTDPLTDLTVIRPVYHRDETMCCVHVENGWFCIDGEGDTPHNDEGVPIGTRIYLVEEDRSDEGMMFMHFLNEDSGETIDRYSSFIVRDNLSAVAEYESFHCIVNIETYCWEGGFVYFADDPVEGEMWAQTQDEVYYGDTVTVCAVSDTENGFTDDDWLGWYRVVYDDYGSEQWILLSTDMTTEIEITRDGMIEAVWDNGNGPNSGSDAPIDLSARIYLKAEGGFIAPMRYNGGYETYSGGEDDYPHLPDIKQNSYSSLMAEAWSEIVMYDDPSDNIAIESWSVTYTAADTEEENTNTIYVSDDSYTTYCIESAEFYLAGSTVFFVGEGTEHTHVWDDGVVIVEPTYTESGEMKYTCSCGEYYIETIPVLPPKSGDVNGDGKISSKDLSLFKRYLADPSHDNGAVFVNCDINGDGRINSKDLSAFKRILSGN